MVDQENVRPLRDGHHQIVFGSLGDVILREPGAQARRVNPDYGIVLWVEVVDPAEYSGRDLFRFDGIGGILQSPPRQVLQQFPKSLRASKGLTVNHSLHLVPEALQECGVARQIWLDMGGHHHPLSAITPMRKSVWNNRCKQILPILLLMACPPGISQIGKYLTRP